MRGVKAWVGQSVVVSTAAFDVRGRLFDVRSGVLVLRDAVVLGDMGNTPVDGTLIIPEAQVRYVQVP